MYGSEFWHLNTTLLSLSKPSWGKEFCDCQELATATSIPLITLDWPSMRCRCLCAKLCFLSRACSGDSNTDTLREEVFKTLSYSDVEALDLVKQCRLLELPYSTNFTSEVLSNSAGFLKGLKKRIIEEDRSYQLKQALELLWLSAGRKSGTRHWIAVPQVPWPHSPSSSCYVKLCLPTENVLWNYAVKLFHLTTH